MNPDHVHFAEWDAAYVVGALSPADRRRFEEHLDDCRACQTALAELASMPGLLARVGRDRAMTLLGTGAGDGPDAAARERVVERGAHEARRRRRTWWATGIAAAVAVIVVVSVAVGTAMMPGPRAGQVVALEPLEPLVSAQITATVALTDVAWGTRLDMECRYDVQPGAGAYGEGPPYVLVVIADDGTATELSTWRALPNATARLEAGTALDLEQIAAIEVRAVGADGALLRGEPDVRVDGEAGE